jgi:hypothetical protein
LVLLLLLPAAPAAAEAQDRTRARCFPKGPATLLQNRVARVYRHGPADDSPRFSVVACIFAKGEEMWLDSPIEGFYAHLPPALALNGTVLGWAATDCSQECATEFHASDLALWPDEPLNYSAATLREDEQVRIGSLTVTRAGGLAWITCPRRTRSEVVPRCLKPGAKAGVYRKAAGFDTPTERLAVGRDIDPSSLRRRKTRISWIEGGERRRASLR